MNLERRTTRTVSAGSFHPLGATPVAGGVNFALYSRNATEVWLLLYDREDGPPTDVIPLADRTRFVHHALVHGVRPGQLYAYRVRGPFDPANGRRFVDAKLLLDPYARALTGKVRDDVRLLAYDTGSPARDLSIDTRDDAECMPRCVVVDDAFDWQGDRPPGIPFEELVIYETHLKGFTAHPSSGVKQPGTYLGFAERIAHLVELGVNAVELLPLHERHVGGFLTARGLTNYWGYDTLGFFAPESAYRAGASPADAVTEFKTLVRELHRAGIEVLLDVVFNHTGEGSELGPTLGFRGIDNPTYYVLCGGPGGAARYYMNWSGCGNVLDLSNPHVIRFVMDALRYWTEVMHVDGFRFDLASVLGRQDGRFQAAASFFDAVSQDPVLARVKLVAEPWDLGDYEVGNFPVDWSEWNGRFRDTARKFVKGDAGQVPELARRIAGSSDLYGDDGRSAYNSVNFVTCHDGFTLHDLLAYDRKHNEANGEGNRDGADDNASWNCGAEGETADPGVLRLRRQLARNHVLLLLLSAGTPMLLGGDEVLRTQRGNNNAYCQDNAISWFDWTLLERNAAFHDFVRRTLRLRRRYPALLRRSFFTGRDTSGDARPDIRWYGLDLGEPAWGDPELRTIAYQLDGREAEDGPGDYLLFVIHNADWNVRGVRLPDPGDARRWRRVVDTSLDDAACFADDGAEVVLDPQDAYVVNPRTSVVLLARRD